MAAAQEATSDLLEPDSDDESDTSSSRRPPAPFRVSEEQLRPIVSAAKRARTAGSTMPKVNQESANQRTNGMEYD